MLVAPVEPDVPAEAPASVCPLMLPDWVSLPTLPEADGVAVAPVEPVVVPLVPVVPVEVAVPPC